MVVLMLFEETNKATNTSKILVSHGVDMNTLHNVVLPNVPPNEIGRYDERMGEWILRE